MKLIEHFVGGKLFSGSSDRKGKVFNPATGEQESEVKLASKSDLNQAVGIAKKAFETWSLKPALQRARVMFKFKELIEKNSDELTKLIVSEHGKVFEDARGSLTRGLEVVEFACGIPHLLKGEFSENVGTNVDSWSMRQPLGVVAGITPFNFPAMVPMWMFPIAIACGNTFILKPSEKDPSCSIMLAQLLTEAGLPDGVFNVVNGDKESVDAILENSDIKAVSFVGSTPIAKYIYENSAKNEKRVQALGGAKNHALVLSDAKISQAIDQLISAAFGSSGQRCMALSVVLVEKKIKQPFMDNLITKVKSLKVGFQKLESNSYGPLVSDDHLNNVQNYIKLAEEEGSKIILDGREINDRRNNDKKGYFLGPTLIDSVKPNMKSYLNEIFGPVLQIIEIDDVEEGIQIINKNSFGNGCCIFTENGNNAREFSEKVDIGMVGVNIPLPVPSSFHSFGGWKNSLFGDLNIYGPDGLRFYTRRKTITQRWFGSNDLSEINLSMPSNQKN